MLQSFKITAYTICCEDSYEVLFQNLLVAGFSQFAPAC